MQIALRELQALHRSGGDGSEGMVDGAWNLESLASGWGGSVEAGIAGNGTRREHEETSESKEGEDLHYE